MSLLLRDLTLSAPTKGGGVPAGFVRLFDIDGSPLNDIDGQTLYEAA